MPRRKRVLFIGEGVTLAHVTRPYLLAKALDPVRYEAILATPDTYASLLNPQHLRLEPLKSTPPGQFLRALSKGTPLYDYATLAKYLEDDLELLRRVQPDLVVGDFRLSLAVSAPLANIPYAALTNAHWSPYAAVRHLPIPEHISTRFFGVSLSQFFFNRMQALIFAAHARPLNRLRKQHGLKPLGDLRNTYTHGDFTLYLDTPGLIPTLAAPDSHHYLGPAIWSPDIPRPDWWDQVDPDRPTVYLTLGSSGQVKALPILLKALSALPVNVIAATAGRVDSALLRHNQNCFAADYLPGSEAAARSDLVICNGGSATVYQALGQGCPVLGIPANLDQHLTMTYVTRSGAGLPIRSDALDVKQAMATVTRILGHNEYQQAAAGIAKEFEHYECRTRFQAWLDKLFTS